MKNEQFYQALEKHLPTLNWLIDNADEDDCYNHLDNDLYLSKIGEFPEEYPDFNPAECESDKLCFEIIRTKIIESLTKETALTFINGLMEQGHYFMLDYDLVSECEVDQSIQDQINIYRELDKQHNWNLQYLTQMLVCKNFPEIVGEKRHKEAIKTLTNNL